MGRRGLVGLFVNKFTTTLRVVGSNPLADFLSFSLLIEECIVSRNEERLCKGNRTCKTRRLKKKEDGLTAKAIESGMVTRNGLVRFEND